MKNIIKRRFAQSREPRQADWHRFINLSEGDIAVKDSTEICDFDSDEIALTSAAVEGFLGVDAPVELVEGFEADIGIFESNVDDFETWLNEIARTEIALLYEDYVVLDGGEIQDLKETFEFLSELQSTHIYTASSIPFIAELYIDEEIEEALRYFTTHIAYVDYVVADGGSVVGLTDTLNFYKEII